jgi:tetratricopeptide (TPR) repeat protein/class 3 adenylate cyclase
MPKGGPEAEWEKRARVALSEGDGLTALRILEEAPLFATAERPGFSYLYAQALAQMGQSKRARVVLKDLLNRGGATCDAVSLVGRTFKENWLRTGSSDALSAAITAYQKAVELDPENPFPAINEASLSLLAGDAASARQLAGRVLQLYEKPRRAKETDRWRDASIGEAYLCLGDFDRAREYYSRTVAAGLDIRERCSARRHARIVLEYLGNDVHSLDDCFALPVVIVFSGHLADPPDSPLRERRFPAELESAVTSEIRQALTRSESIIGFSSAAAGADILFLEQMKSLGQTYHVLLSGPRAQFKERSVDYAGATWGERFQQVLASAKTVDEASSHHPADNSVADWFATRLLSCRALMQAQQLNLDLIALAVWNGKPGLGRGGTASFVDHWKRDFRQPLGQAKPRLSIIRLDSFLPEQVATNDIKEEPADHLDANVDAPAECQVQQDFKAILLANVIGFERLTEGQLPSYNEHFLGAAAQTVSSTSDRPTVVNAWGNGFRMIFEEVDQAGRFALRLREALEPPPGGAAEWVCHGLPADLGVSITLHAGPVFSLLNPLTHQTTFIGGHVDFAASLEPITKKGQIFTTEAFAVLASADALSGFFCEYIGYRNLPKVPSEMKVYRLIRTE